MKREIDIREYMENRSGDDIIVDLRSEIMYRCGTIPGAVNIPVERIGELYELPKEKPVYLFCQVGDISGEFAELLADAGYDVCNLKGGYREYLRKSLIDGEAESASSRK